MTTSGDGKVSSRPAHRIEKGLTGILDKLSTRSSFSSDSMGLNLEIALSASDYGELLFAAPQGSGVDASCRVEDCAVCRGSGEVLRSVLAPSGAKVTQLGACPACGGRGSSRIEFCKQCGGEGRAKVKRTLSVKVPAGACLDS